MMRECFDRADSAAGIFERVADIAFCGFTKGSTKNAMLVYDLSVKSAPDILENVTEASALASFLFHARYRTAEYVLARNGGGILFAFSNEYYREDHLKKFLLAAGTAEKHDIIYPNPLAQPCRTGWSGFHIRLLARLWRFQMRHSRLTPREQMFVLSYLAFLYRDSRAMLKLVRGAYGIAVFFFDAGPVESVVAATLKRRGTKTATLQHGMCSSVSLCGTVDPAPTILNCLFSMSQADCVLLWNEISRQQCLRLGLAEDRLFVCGALSLIGVPCNAPGGSHTDTIGIVLDACVSDNDRSNREMITIANTVCAQLGLKYVLRYHPTSSGREYSDVAMPEYLAQVQTARTNIPLNEYVKGVDLTLLCRSSALCEIAGCNGLAFRYVPKWRADSWQGFSDDTFSDADALAALYGEQKHRREEMISRLHAKMATSFPPEVGYRRFWERFR